MKIKERQNRKGKLTTSVCLGKPQKFNNNNRKPNSIITGNSAKIVEQKLIILKIAGVNQLMIKNGIKTTIIVTKENRVIIITTSHRSS